MRVVTDYTTTAAGPDPLLLLLPASDSSQAPMINPQPKHGDTIYIENGIDNPWIPAIVNSVNADGEMLVGIRSHEHHMGASAVIVRINTYGEAWKWPNEINRESRHSASVFQVSSLAAKSQNREIDQNYPAPYATPLFLLYPLSQRKSPIYIALLT